MNTEFSTAAMPQFKPDLSKIFNEVKEVATNPVGCWSTVRGTYSSDRDFMMNFLGPLLLLGPVVDFLMGLSARGFAGGAMFLVVRVALSVVMAYLVAFILAKLAASFGGTNDTRSALKLYGYSQSPALLAAILGFLPVLGGLAVFLIGLYCFYVFYQGISPMLAVPAEQRVIYTIVSVVILIITGFLLGLLTMMLVGGAVLGTAGPVVS